MKSVGNLTDFVRGHMLEAFDVAPRIKALIGHFDDLNRAHEAVLKAKRQVHLLAPLVDDCAHHAALVAQVDELRAGRDALRCYFAAIKLELLDKRIVALEEDWQRLDLQVQRTEERLARQRGEQRDLERDIAQNGGERIAQIERAMIDKQAESERRRVRAQRYNELARSVGLLNMTTAMDFLAQRQSLSSMSRLALDQEAGFLNQWTEHSVALRRGKQQHDELAAEINSLKARRSNIPAEQVAMRSGLCKALGLPEADMPFAGELLQLRDDERVWEGAAERLMRNFGLSLLVPEEHYAPVADWVDKTQLKGRLVYFRVRQGSRAELPNLHRDSLARKLTVKPDCAFYDWLERELAHRFDVACCATQEQFRRETRAMTRAGQIKAPGERHEKDDRHRLDDRSRYVLGWTNAAKIAALDASAKKLGAGLGELGNLMGKIQAEQTMLKERLTVLSRLDEYTEFRELDWQSLAVELAQLADEKQALEAASDVLKQLGKRLDEVVAAIKATQAQSEEQRDKRSKAEQRKSDAQALYLLTKAVLDEPGVAAHQKCFERLDALRGEVLGEHHLSVESCDNRERAMRDWLQARIDGEDHKLKRLRDKIIDAMRAYCTAFVLDTQEVDVAIEAVDEYRNMLGKLKADDLPRFEARFKELLNENTIREVANFQSQLARERETIKERIARINESLTQIDYNPGRYIVLEAQAAPDADVRDFQTELRACTEGALTGSDDAQYSEAKFLQVKHIIERFRGRDGLSEQDRRWTTKVTDVRHWFVFAASERWREDNSEHEHYSDSGGKSGGQKEKLAYTILAASLAYQFGLEWGALRSRSFRFVVIDEAFGRGSDESAQYGLRLFAQLRLQFLIVTPLQKIHIIEPFVSSVGFVHNEEGHASKLRDLSIEEYRSEKARLLA